MKKRHQHKRIEDNAEAEEVTLVKNDRGKDGRVCLKKGTNNSKSIAQTIFNGVNYYLHATKGYRAMID